MSFTLHPNFKSKTLVAELPLCRVLLEDEKHYPWLIAVPRVPGASRLIDLSSSDQMQLMIELDFIQRMMWKEFKPTQLNVAAIGNKTPQLHIHVIARYDNDPAWPGTVWDHPVKERYGAAEKSALIERLKSLLSALV